MRKRRHYKKTSEQAELDVTTFLNLMVVLIPFLLITAVFSRITIQELNVPEASAGGADQDKPLVTIEVIVRQDKLQISNGKAIVTTIPQVDGEHDIPTLSGHLMGLKERYPDKEDAILLVEPDIEYETIIQIMDAVKVAEIPPEASDDGQAAEDAQDATLAGAPVPLARRVLFPQLSVGDAP